jgi:hypothetical protein
MCVKWWFVWENELRLSPKVEVVSDQEWSEW